MGSRELHQILAVQALPCSLLVLIAVVCCELVITRLCSDTLEEDEQYSI